MVFLDANILLEITLRGRPHFRQVQQFLIRNQEESAISILTAHLVMHFGRKEQTEDGFLQAVIGENKLLAVTPDDYAWAITNERGTDFEDALQISTALRAGCQTFLTLDRSLAKAYASAPIQIIVP